jgi:hypothetical protein
MERTDQHTRQPRPRAHLDDVPALPPLPRPGDEPQHRASALAWLRPGRDHQLAATRYPGRQSATARNRERNIGKDSRRIALDLLGLGGQR